MDDITLSAAICYLQSVVTDLVECGHEAGVVVEGRHDQSVVLLMDVQGGLHVHFGVLETNARAHAHTHRSEPVSHF